MLKLASFVVELLRICILLVFTLLVLDGLEKVVYQSILGQPLYHWSMALGNMILFLVLYRNYFQFKGWYKSENNKKLNKVWTRSLVIISLVLLLVPIWIN